MKKSPNKAVRPYDFLEMAFKFSLTINSVLLQFLLLNLKIDIDL